MFPFEPLSVHKQGCPAGRWPIKQPWLGIKNDYRTLVDLESVNVVEKSEEDDEAEGNE